MRTSRSKNCSLVHSVLILGLALAAATASARVDRPNAYLPNETATGALYLDSSNQIKATGAPTAGQVMKWNSTTSSWRPEADLGTDNLGDHTATQNVETNDHWISNDGDSEGLFVDAAGYVGIGTSSPNQQLEVAGTIFSSTGGFKFPDATTQTTAAITSLTGDVSGSGAGAATTSVIKLQGRSISTSSPSNQHLLMWNSSISTWEPAYHSGLTALTTGAELVNCSISAAISAGDLQVSLKGAAGGNITSTNPCYIRFRDSTATSGANSAHAVTTTPNVYNIVSGATVGCQDAIECTIYVYVSKNGAGNIKIGFITGKILDEGELHTSSTMSTSADSPGVLYMSSGASNHEVRLVGRIKITQATAGTWVTSPSEVASWPFETAVETKRAKLNCDSGSAITSQKPASWVTSIGNVASGACAVDVTAAGFASTPYCHVTPSGAFASAGLILSVDATSATDVSVDCEDDASSECTSFDFILSCEDGG